MPNEDNTQHLSNSNSQIIEARHPARTEANRISHLTQ